MNFGFDAVGGAFDKQLVIGLVSRPLLINLSIKSLSATN